MSLDLGYKCSNFTTFNGALYECHGKSINSDSFIQALDYLGHGVWKVTPTPDYPAGVLWLCEKHRFEDLMSEL